MKEESEEVGLKLNTQKTKIMASGPTTSWERVETVTDFIFWAPNSLHGVNALAIVTISDCPLTGEETSSHERQVAFTKMMEIALELA